MNSNEKLKYLSIAFCLLLSVCIVAQTTTLESEINMDGVVFPRLTTADRDGLATSMNPPVLGQCIYNIDINKLECYDGASWQSPVDGINGADGANGTDGVDGANGTNGLDGANGMDGTNGTDGANGMDGTNGTDGVDGLNCWDLNGNGMADANEDTNGDGVTDAQDCHGLKFRGIGFSPPASANIQNPVNGDVYVYNLDCGSSPPNECCSHVYLYIVPINGNGAWVRIFGSDCT